jgi:membrane-bound lytic murein transglycosylase A
LRREARTDHGRAVPALALAAALAACAPVEEPPRLALEPVAVSRLPGWGGDAVSEALPALKASCAAFAAAPPGRAVGPDRLFGTAADWRDPCARLGAVPTGDDEAARAALAQSFRAFRATNRGNATGLVTGYYEPELRGSRAPSGRFRVPLYRTPPDLVTADLGLFRPAFAGERIAGRVDGTALKPYAKRAEIERGALAGRQVELLWVDDAIAKFFLQIQGSGQIRLDDGEVVRVGYASRNGHPYRAIGRDLIEIGALTPEEVSLQSIRAWLQAHPQDAAAMMARNPSYIFFREHPELAAADGPLGTEGVPLTAGRSLAVDRRFLPLGVPLWLDTTAPWPEGAAPLRRLMVAQDTGGAIKGVVRGDVYWGSGARAEAIAGPMRSPGRYAILLPRALVPTS